MSDLPKDNFKNILNKIKKLKIATPKKPVNSLYNRIFWLFTQRCLHANMNLTHLFKWVIILKYS
jgi:hypothetical protein